MNLPPPYVYALLGKRMMFPRPTAEPTAARMNSLFELHLSPPAVPIDRWRVNERMAFIGEGVDIASVGGGVAG